jgi:hypothetical protein
MREENETLREEPLILIPYPPILPLPYPYPYPISPVHPLPSPTILSRVEFRQV